MVAGNDEESTGSFLVSFHGLHYQISRLIRWFHERLHSLKKEIFLVKSILTVPGYGMFPRGSWQLYVLLEALAAIDGRIEYLLLQLCPAASATMAPVPDLKKLRLSSKMIRPRFVENLQRRFAGVTFDEGSLPK